MIWMYVGLGAAGLIMLLVGILMIVLRSKKKDRCALRCKGKICDVKTYHGSGKEKDLHHAIYEYEYDGKTYTHESNVASSKMPKVGKEVTIYINPEKPKEYYMKSFSRTFANILVTGLGVVFIVLTIILYFTVGV